MDHLTHKIMLGDCLTTLREMADSSADLVYLDPPFFSNKHHSAVTRDRTKKFSFSDVWNGLEEYAVFMEERLNEVRRILKVTGSVFVHCNSRANFLLRILLDQVFGEEQFRSEIIWSYRRWSNSAKGLMPAHQTIFFYSKTDQYKFNRAYSGYSETTNVDQILQLRSRDSDGVSRYATDMDGNVVFGADQKQGVPLSDVWEIPFLNPKAKERTGYPTQKPILLLERIIEMTTEPGDLVVDPFCGSGTTVVAAALLGRRSFGVDCSVDAVELAQQRLKAPHKTESALLKKGRAAYVNADASALGILAGLDLIPVHRNGGIDAFIRGMCVGGLIPVRVQREGEALEVAGRKLFRAAVSRKEPLAILVRTSAVPEVLDICSDNCHIEVVASTGVHVGQRIAELRQIIEAVGESSKRRTNSPSKEGGRDMFVTASPGPLVGCGAG